MVIYSLNKRGLICDGAELQKVEDKEDGWLAAMEALFTVIKEEEAAKGPLIVLVKVTYRHIFIIYCFWFLFA